MLYPELHFPGTPRWVKAAVSEAIKRTGVSLAKWTVPLEAIGRYESNYNPSANLCKDDTSLPIGIMQQSRDFYRDAKVVDPEAHEGLGGFSDPVRSFVMAILHINSNLNVSGGYDGIGRPDGTIGLVPRTDRGPGNVLRKWIEDPENFDVEEARDLYRGY